MLFSSSLAVTHGRILRRTPVLSAQKTTPQVALAFVRSTQAAAAAAKEYAAELQKGLGMFGIAAPPHADLDQTIAVSAMPCVMSLLLWCSSLTSFGAAQ